jgi:C4-dicarboxylate-specific signal transduction histidine kinase
MTTPNPPAEGLTFFGRVSASISHELKNVLATISETAGLLGDLVELAGEGRKLNPDELTSCSNTIIDEIQRGYATIALLNTFAHSVDEPFREVDLADTVTLAVDLSKCLSYARRIDLDLAPAIGVKVITNPFFLVDLLYNCLVWAYRSVEPDQGIGLAVEATGDAFQVRLTDLGTMEGISRDEVGGALEVLKAELSMEASGQGLTVTVPKRLA